MSSPKALCDEDLVEAMRRGGREAAAEFDARFHPVLRAYAQRVKIPAWEWPSAVAEVLADEALRLTTRNDAPPANIGAYLVRCLRNRYLNEVRAASRRERNHNAAADDYAGEWVVTTLCSEAALRASAGPEPATPPTRSVLERLAADLRSSLTDEEYSILMWISQGAAHAEIAEWLGSSYDASTKRIWRLCRRLRAAATERAATYSPAEQSEFERFLRRVNRGASERPASARRVVSA